MDDRRRRLVLWDVDGTLVWAGRAGSRAFYDAVREVLGRDATAGRVMMSGKTDPQIALEILASIAVHGDQAMSHLPDVLRSLERHLEEAVETIRREGHAMPGAVGALRRLSRVPGVVQSVLSGNLAANARLKLGAFGLDQWLDLDAGAYGSDDQDRAALVPIALTNVERAHGVRFQPRDVWVVGDTERDLECAHAGGARCLLVATGRPSLDQLEGLGADALLPDLSDTEEVLRVLLDWSG